MALAAIYLFIKAKIVSKLYHQNVSKGNGSDLNELLENPIFLVLNITNFNCYLMSIDDLQVVEQLIIMYTAADTYEASPHPSHNNPFY